MMLFMPDAMASSCERDIFSGASANACSCCTNCAVKSGITLLSSVAKTRACVGDHSLSPITTLCASSSWFFTRVIMPRRIIATWWGVSLAGGVSEFLGMRVIL